MAFLILIVFVIAVLSYNFIFRRSKVISVPESIVLNIQTPAESKKRLNELIVPENIFFGKGHTWVEIRRSGNIRLGIDDFIMKVLDGVDKVSVEAINKKVKKGDVLFSLENGDKKLSFCAPVSGTVYSLNDNLFTDPKLITTDPYDQGWVCTLMPLNLSAELRVLKIADESKKWLIDEMTRLKEFLHIRGNNIALEGGTLLDGGEPVQGVLSQLDDKVWEKFEEEFLKD